MPKFLTEGESDLFTLISDANYVRRVNSKDTLFQGTTFSEFSYKGLSPYKIHVSLTEDDYRKHKDGLVKIILDHLSERSLVAFKFINTAILEEEINDLKLKLINIILENLDFDQRANFNPSDQKDVSQKLLKIKNDLQPDSDQAQIIAKLEDDLLHAERFSMGDQFTFYLGKNFSKEELAQLCHEVDRYIKENNLKAVDHYEIVSLITGNISLRQTHTLQDFHRMQTLEHVKTFNKFGVDLPDTKIEVIPFYGQNNNEEKRKTVKAEVEKSDLYKFLVKYIAINASSLKP